MNVIYLESFEKDIRKLRDKRAKTGLLSALEGIRNCERLIDLQNLKKIKGDKNFYRVKVGDYRLGIKVEEGTVTFIRFLHRKDIYRYFP